MADMLVRLYDLPDGQPYYKALEEQGIRIIRPMTPNKTKVCDWIQEKFGKGWSDETSTAFTKFPVSCFIAYRDADKKILGFAGYDCTAPDFFGPTGVDPEFRKLGIGRALLIRCMEALREEGYGYAIIGGVGPKEFYRKSVGAELIEGSTRGLYKDLI